MGGAPGPHGEPLVGGRSTPGIVRIGGTVRRPLSPRAPFVRDLLVHLEAVRFAGAPRYRGIDGEGREVLTYVDGEVSHRAEPGAWTDGQLRRAAALLRGFHDATAGSVLAGREEVVCHNDFAPWNTVFVRGLPVALIDFDDARPGSRIRDVSYALWCWLAIGNPAITMAEQARRIGLVCEAYGFDGVGAVVPEIAARQREILAKHTANGWHEQAGRVAAEIEWLGANGGELARRLGRDGVGAPD